MIWGGNGLKWKLIFRTHTQREIKIAPRSRHEPKSPFDFDFKSHPDRTPSTLPRSRPRIAHLQLRQQTQKPGSHAFDFAGFANLRLRRDRIETAPITPIALRSQLRNGWVLMNLTGFDELFFVGFCFCVYLRNGIIYLFGSWENVMNKKKMCFLYYFQQHN